MSYKYKPLPHTCSLPAPGAFWPRWFYQVLHPGIARMRNTLHCLYRQAWHFKTSEFRQDRNAKYAIVIRRRYIAMRNNTHFTWMKASLQCYCMSSPITVQKCIGTELYLIIAHSSHKHQDGHLSNSNRIRYLRVTVEYILIIEIDLLYGWAVLERRPNHVNKRVVADIWLLTVSWTLTWEMIQIRNFYCFAYRQHIWLRKWEVIVGGHDWSCWDLWILGGRGFVGVQRRSCYTKLNF